MRATKGLEKRVWGSGTMMAIQWIHLKQSSFHPWICLFYTSWFVNMCISALLYFMFRTTSAVKAPLLSNSMSMLYPPRTPVSRTCSSFMLLRFELNLSRINLSWKGPLKSRHFLISFAIIIIIMGMFFFLVQTLAYLESSLHSWSSSILKSVFANGVPVSLRKRKERPPSQAVYREHGHIPYKASY